MISVVIRTKNSAGTLPETLSGLGLAPEDELIVVDSGSSDDTLAIAEAGGARIIQLTPPFHYSRALNAGFAEAQADWILSLSSHCIPLNCRLIPEFRRALAMTSPELAVIYGSLHLSANPLVIEEPQWYTPQWFSKMCFVPGGNGNALYRKRIWEQHPFSERVPTSEDIEWFRWAMSQGYHAFRFPAAAVLYRNRSSLRWMFKKGLMEVRVGRGLLGNRIPATFRDVALGVGSLAKGVIKGYYPPSVGLRQLSHRLGSFAGSWLPPWKEDVFDP